MNDQNMSPAAEEPDIGWEITKKIAKIIFRLLLLYCIVSCVIYCIPPLREGYWELRVKTYVQLHQKALNEYVETFPLDESTYQKYHGWKAICYPVFREGPGQYLAENYDLTGGDPYYIQFGRFGFGIAPSSSYAGMFYSPDDSPEGYLRNFYPPDTDVLSDNEALVEKICDNWYYYLESY